MSSAINKQPSSSNLNDVEQQDQLTSTKNISPVVEQRDNFPKGLRGGGACFDCLACLCFCCALEEIACFECCRDC